MTICSTRPAQFVAVLGLMAFVVIGCGQPANDSATSAKVTFHVNEMGERLHLF